MIKLENVSKSYNGASVFENLSAEFREGQVSCILGASGVGKTTLIRLLSGLVKPDSGNVILPPGARPSYVFQEPRLLPWYNVYNNLDFVLRDIYPKERRKEIIMRYLKLVGLEDYCNAPLTDLSGGMIQRVSLCRAFIYPSDILCLDEPFVGLDIKLKEELAEAFAKIYEDDGRTVFFVTHSLEEAKCLADTIYILAGRPAKIAAVIEKDEFDKELHLRLRELL